MAEEQNNQGRKMSRTIIIWALAGVVLGALAGYGFGKLTEVIEPPGTAPQGLNDIRPPRAQCYQSQPYEVRLFWRLPSGVARNELYRSTDGGASLLLSDRSGRNESSSTFIDKDVGAGRTYMYHFETDGNVSSDDVEVLISPETCIVAK